METDSPDVVIAKRLLDHLTLRGFEFRRSAPGDDGPLVGNRMSSGLWIDTIRIEGFSRDHFASRKQTSSLIIPDDELGEHRTNGSALTVLNEVSTWETAS